MTLHTAIRDFLATCPETEHETMSAMGSSDRVKLHALHVVAEMYGDSDLGCLLAALVKAEIRHDAAANHVTDDSPQLFADALDEVDAAHDVYHGNMYSDASSYFEAA
jgi:hypothetical protein